MARSSFGGGAADYVENSVGTRLPGAITTFWTAQTAGTQHTDLIVSGGAATTVTAGVRGYLPAGFDGPDGVQEMWADGGGGIRTRLAAYTGILTVTTGDARYLLPATASGLYGARTGGTTLTAQSAPWLYARDYGVVANGTVDDTTALQAAINAAAAAKLMLFLPSGTLKLSATINIPSGLIMRGVGLEPTSGTPTRLQFATIADTFPALKMDNISEVALSDFYLSGRTAGKGGSEIATFNNCRGISLERITINSLTSASGVHFGVTGSVIRSSIQGVTSVQAANGFTIGAACTSIAMSNCYGESNTVSGYVLSGTYLSLTSCAADNNGLYGYFINGAVGVSFISCGAELNGRTGWHHSNANGIVHTGGRGHLNNTLNLTTISTYANLNDNTRNVTFVGCTDTPTNAAAPFSISSFQGTVNPVTVLNCDLAKGLSPGVDNLVAVSTIRTTAGTAARASMRVPHGAAPTTPVDGDIWSTTAGLFVRINGVTVGPLT